MCVLETRDQPKPSNVRAHVCFSDWFRSETDEASYFETETETETLRSPCSRPRLRLRLSEPLTRDRDWDWDHEFSRESRIFRDFYLIEVLKKGLQTWPRCLHETETETETLGSPYTRPRLRLRLRKSLTRDWDRDWDSRLSRDSRETESLVCLCLLLLANFGHIFSRKNGWSLLAPHKYYNIPIVRTEWCFEFCAHKNGQKKETVFCLHDWWRHIRAIIGMVAKVDDPLDTKELLTKK